MTKYQNGRIPSSALVALDSPLHWSSPKGAAMWYALRRNVQAKYGVTLHITPGKNAYRDMAAQKFARENACKAGNCNSAAKPGWSSHGGTWQDWRKGFEWIDAMAFDIGDWAQLKEDVFYAEVRAVGMEPGLIRPQEAGHTEPWHIVVPDPWGAVPASLTATPLTESDEDMIIRIQGKAGVRRGGLYYISGGKATFLGNDTGTSFPVVTDDTVIANLQKLIPTLR